LDADLIKETRGRSELLGQLSECELLLALAIFAHAPKRQRLGSFPGTTLHDIPREVEVARRF